MYSSKRTANSYNFVSFPADIPSRSYDSFPFFIGVHTHDNHYTSPILSLHIWNKSLHLTKSYTGPLATDDRQNRSRLDKNQLDTVLSPTIMNHENKIGVDEEIQIIPIEDIISIKVKSEIKKAVKEEKRRWIKTTPTRDVTFNQQMKNYCIKHFCCWCCEEKKVAAELLETETKKKEATRCIVITIKHLCHSYVDTPSNVRVLSVVKQAEFYEKQLEVNIIKFSYFQSENFDEVEYNSKLGESETLARIVMQLKAMNGHYPDSSQLEQIIQQQQIRPFGFEIDEN